MKALEVILAVVTMVGASVCAIQEREPMSDDKSTDEARILAHIDSIFQAYIARDRDAIKRLHTQDWVGFQGPSTSIERGIDAYMKNADASLAQIHGNRYELLDTEVQIYGDIALVYYVATYTFHDNEGVEGTMRLKSIDVYRREHGEWNQAGSNITPIVPRGPWGPPQEENPRK